MNLLKTAADPRGFAAPSLFYASAREGMYDLLRTTFSTSGRRILLPAYIGWSPREGSGVFDPVRTLDLNYTLYPIAADLSASVGSIRRELEIGDVAAVVLIHYFGRTDAAVEEVARLAREAGAIFVEDLAHGFFSAFCGARAGRNSDVNLYSLHKMFPLQDGGMLQYRNSGLISSQRETRPELSRSILDYDWYAIASVRVRNFQLAVSELRSLPEHGGSFELVWEALQGGDVPQSLPIRILRGDRDKLYESLNRRGVGMVSLYHTLIPEAHEFEVAVNNSRQLINFPVHQDVDPSVVADAVRAFGEALNEVS